MNEQLARVTDSHLVQKTDIGFTGMNLEVPAECFNGQVRSLGDFLQVDLPVAFAKGKFKDRVHAAFFVSWEFAGQQRELLQSGGGGKEVQQCEESNEPLQTFCVHDSSDTFDHRRCDICREL